MNEEGMGLIEAASGACRTMADGTLRIEFDVEPRFAVAAFTLFGQRGTPAVLGRLVVPKAEPEPENPSRQSPSVKRERMAPLCEWAVMRCGEPAFQAWASHQAEAGGGAFKYPSMEAEARGVLLNLCGVESRKELDTNPEAAKRFHERVRKPYTAWLEQQKVPA